MSFSRRRDLINLHLHSDRFTSPISQSQEILAARNSKNEIPDGTFHTRIALPSFKYSCVSSFN